MSSLQRLKENNTLVSDTTENSYLYLDGNTKDPKTKIRLKTFYCENNITRRNPPRPRILNSGEGFLFPISR